MANEPAGGEPIITPGAPDDEPPTGLWTKLGIAGGMWALRATLRGIHHELAEANRLERLHIRAITQAPTIIADLTPGAAPAGRKAKEHDLEIMPSGDAHYAGLQAEFDAARARGEQVDLDTDPATLHDPERRP
jgi:hypothetical protein